MDEIERKSEEYARKRHQHIEDLIWHYMKETGLSARQIKLVEQRSDDGMRTEWFCEPRGEEDGLSRSNREDKEETKETEEKHWQSRFSRSTFQTHDLHQREFAS